MHNNVLKDLPRLEHTHIVSGCTLENCKRTGAPKTKQLQFNKLYEMIGSSQIGSKLDHPYWKFIFNKLYKITSNFHNFIFIPAWIIPKSMVSPSYLHPFQSLTSTSVPPIPLHPRDSLGTLQDSKCFFAPNPGPKKNTRDMTHSVDGRNPALGMYRTL